MASPSAPPRTRTLILGAAGRDFHDFNVLYRDDPSTEVVAFTAAQIPHIANRRYPPALAGALYPAGIPVLAQEPLEDLIARMRVDRVVFAYSDVSQVDVIAIGERSLACGAAFVLPGPRETMIECRLPVIAVCAARTGCGKSALARWVCRELRARGLRPAIVRHPMPYADLARQAVQRFACAGDLAAAGCTLEEREEYEPHVAEGNVVHAGVDYARVLAAAQEDADVIVWDGGNNDFPFARPDLLVAVVDAWRPGHARGWHPGEAVVRAADVIVVNKVDTATPESADAAAQAARSVNARAAIVRGRMPIQLDRPERVRGARVLAVEDGPTLTHGGMSIGAGAIAARAAGAASLVDPRPWAPPALREELARYPALGPVLPAIGYSREDLDLLERTIAATPADVVVAGTPLDLAALVASDKPWVRARYEFEEDAAGELARCIDAFLARTPPAGGG